MKYEVTYDDGTTEVVDEGKAYELGMSPNQEAYSEPDTSTDNVWNKEKQYEITYEDGSTGLGTYNDLVDNGLVKSPVQESVEKQTWHIGPWDTGISMGEKATVFWVNVGEGMMNTYEGVKQILGIDEQEMATNHELVNELNRQYGDGITETAGQMLGMVADPVGLMAGGAAANLALKSASYVNKAENIITLPSTAKSIAYSATAGAGFGAISYVDERAGEERVQNVLLGAAFGGVLGFAGKKLNDHLVLKSSDNSKLAAVELEYAKTEAELLKANPQATQVDVLSKLSERSPELMREANEVVNRTGRQPNFAAASDNLADLKIQAEGIKEVNGGTGGGFDKWVSTMSNNMRKIDKGLFSKWREMEFNMHSRVHAFSKEREKLSNIVGTMSNKMRGDFNWYLMNGERSAAIDLMQKFKGEAGVVELNKIFGMIDDMGAELVERGVLKKDQMIANYWHRWIDDFEGFAESAGKTEKFDQTAFDKYISALEAKSLKNRKHGLTEVEKGQALQAFLSKSDADISRVRFASDRKIGKIDRELVDYYADPIKALDGYFHNAINESEIAKFLGKSGYEAGFANSKDINGLWNATNAMSATDILTHLSPEKQAAALSMLEARLGRSRMGANEAVRLTKQLTYAGLLANPISAITQLGDLGVAVYKNGLISTVKSIGKHLIGKNDVEIDSLGLTQQLIQELNDSSSSKTFEKLMNWSGFAKVDMFGKSTMINSSVDSAIKAINNPTSKRYIKFSEKYRDIFGDRFSDLVADLKKFEASGRSPDAVTDNMRFFTWNELSDVQPISMMELPEMYARLGGNWNSVYMLKSFMLKQLDILRTDGVDLINQGKYREGMYNIAKYSAIIGASNMGADKVKSFAMGRENFDDTPEEIALQWTLNIFKTFGMTEYLLDGIRGNEPLQELAKAYIIPPLSVWEDIAWNSWKVKEDDLGNGTLNVRPEKLVKYVPVGGKLADQWLLGGKEQANVTRMEAEGLSPWEYKPKADERKAGIDIPMYADGGDVKDPRAASRIQNYQNSVDEARKVVGTQTGEGAPALPPPAQSLPTEAPMAPQEQMSPDLAQLSDEQLIQQQMQREKEVTRPGMYDTTNTAHKVGDYLTDIGKGAAPSGNTSDSDYIPVLSDAKYAVGKMLGLWTEPVGKGIQVAGDMYATGTVGGAMDVAKEKGTEIVDAILSASDAGALKAATLGMIVPAFRKDPEKAMKFMEHFKEYSNSDGTLRAKEIPTHEMNAYFQKEGVYAGVTDNLPRMESWVEGFEVSPKFEELASSGTGELTVKEVLSGDNASEMLSMFPQLADYKVKLDPNMSSIGKVEGDVITLNSKYDLEQIKGTLHHELQHNIQDIEEMAGGGSSTDWRLLDDSKEQSLYLDMLDQVNILRAEQENVGMTLADWSKSDPKGYSEFITKAVEIDDQMKPYKEKIRENYRNLYGEKEARAVQVRRTMATKIHDLELQKMQEIAKSKNPEQTEKLFNFLIQREKDRLQSIPILTDFVSDLGQERIVRSAPNDVTKSGKVVMEESEKTDILDGLVEEFTAPNKGYHAGDAGYGRDTTLGRMDYGRSTGHFGTGVYMFSSEKKAMKHGYDDRPVHEIDLDNVNMFKPNDYYAARDLHNGMREINSVTDAYRGGYLDMVDERVDAALSQLESAGVLSQSKKTKDQLRDQIILSSQNAAERKSANNHSSEYDETSATSVMKWLGYKGVDVRHLEDFDNSQYGTVLYTDKVKDTVRKRAEGGKVSKEPEMQKYEPGLYKDDAGQYWKVDTKGNLEPYRFD